MKEKFEVLKERVKDNFNKNKIVISVMILIWIVTVVFTLISYKDSLGKKSYGNEAFDKVVELCEGTSIKEIIPVKEESDAVVLKMATYARKNSGTFTVKIIGLRSNKVYADKKVNVKMLQDNAFMTISLNENIDPEVDHNIEIFLESECEEGKAAGVYLSNNKAFDGSLLSINDEMAPGDLSLRFLNKNEDMMLFYRIVIVFVIITFSLIIFLLLLVKPGYEVIFTVMAICFGLTFWLIITPMSVPDETIHYEYSFQLSNMIMGKKDHVIFDEEYQNYGSFAGHMNISAAYERFIKKINRPMSLDEKNVKMNYDINDSYKICFVPQALGITVARLLNWNMLRTFYLGRLFNLAFYVVCVYLAIKRTPVHKLLLGIMATLPIFMQQAASFSYDCYINGLTFVIIASLFKWMYQEEKITYKDLAFVFIINAMIAPIKVLYGLFSFLFWFVPVTQFENRKQKIIMTLIVTAPAMYELTILLAPLTWRIIRKAFEHLFLKENTADISNNVLSVNNDLPYLDPDGEIYTFADVTDHPIEALILVIRTIRYSIKTWFYASFGRALSGNTLILPTYLVHGLLALLIAASIRQEDHVLSIPFKICVLIICVFAGLMVVGGMLISWTEVDQEVIEAFGGPIIQGIQGRYFSPFLPYLFPILQNKKIKLPKKIDPYLIYIFIIIVFEVVVYVLSYTFMN